MSTPPKSNHSERPKDFDLLEDIAHQDMQFIAYLEGDLSPQERNEFRAQLLREPELRREFDAFGEIMGATQSLPLEPLPANFVDQVQARIRAESNGRFFNARASQRSYIPYEAISAAMILLMAAAWIAMGTPRDHRIHHVDVTTAPQLHTNASANRN